MNILKSRINIYKTLKFQVSKHYFIYLNKKLPISKEFLKIYNFIIILNATNLSKMTSYLIKNLQDRSRSPFCIVITKSNYASELRSLNIYNLKARVL